MILTAVQAATELKTRPEVIYRLLSEGKIPAYREGNNWKIPARLLQAYVEDRAISEAKERRKIHEEAQKEVQMEQGEV